MDYGLWTIHYGLWTMHYGLWSMDDTILDYEWKPFLSNKLSSSYCQAKECFLSTVTAAARLLRNEKHRQSGDRTIVQN